MTSSHGRRWPLMCAISSCVLFVAVPASAPRTVPELAKARHEAAVKQYNETWVYFRQDRIDSYQVYVWSRILLDCEREIAQKRADHITALESHRGRMQKLDALITRIRRLGFGRSYDVGAAQYYRVEADYWLEAAKAKK